MGTPEAYSTVWRDSAPSALPGISPTRGEIASFGFIALFATWNSAKPATTADPPLVGEMSGRTEGREGTQAAHLSTAT
ncbi:diaminohydroxyphosphoribosylaminopyrimidine deaminase [Mesorhizobium sp. B2-4-14]|nr:diaminohydroxyphosphoribosylaminopyrimidine deaminase [Mesorhizobium sp. B2-4-17]TPL05393.1 diaminohydroxyphosphoribosylaminopyrimidine deaminase [Mesorhizobium sp. B2-4-14]